MAQKLNENGMVEYLRHDGQLCERKPKKNGKKGSERRGDIPNRRKCIADIFERYESITVHDLMDEMRDEARSYGFTMPASQATINSDLRVLGLNGGGKTVLKDPDEADDKFIPFINLNYSIKKKIRQIIVSCLYTERILYMAKSENKCNFESFKDYYKPIKGFIHERKTNNQLKDARLLHFYIVFNESGFEDYIGNVFINNCSFVLYTASHNRCVEIVTPLNKIWSMLHCTYHLIE